MTPYFHTEGGADGLAGWNLGRLKGSTGGVQQCIYLPVAMVYLLLASYL